eukprot:11155780-Lingulodinium_polyedra.AAC.1
MAYSMVLNYSNGEQSLLVFNRGESSLIEYSPVQSNLLRGLVWSSVNPVLKRAYSILWHSLL